MKASVTAYFACMYRLLDFHPLQIFILDKNHTIIPPSGGVKASSSMSMALPRSSGLLFSLSTDDMSVTVLE